MTLKGKGKWYKSTPAQLHARKHGEVLWRLGGVKANLGNIVSTFSHKGQRDKLAEALRLLNEVEQEVRNNYVPLK